jgi:hypothetical protein
MHTAAPRRPAQPLRLRAFSAASTLFLLCCAVCPAPTLRAQGTLTPPPGAPTPTMKSLSQLSAEIAATKDEARIPISPTTTPGDANNVYIITQPGAYFLTADIVAPVGKNAIRINLPGFGAGALSLDLGGYGIIGPGAATTPATHGIQSISIHHATTIRGGHLRGWPAAAITVAGPASVSEVTVTDGGGPGIYLVGGAAPASGQPGTQLSQIDRCVARGVREVGLHANNGLVSNSMVGGVVPLPGGTAVTGISAALVNDCIVRAVDGSSSASARATGIAADGVISRCTVENVIGAGVVHGMRAATVADSRASQTIAAPASNGEHASIFAQAVGTSHVIGLQANTSGLVSGIRAAEVRDSVVERVANAGAGGVAGLRAQNVAGAATGSGTTSALLAEGNVVSGIGGLGISGQSGPGHITLNLVRGCTGDAIGALTSGIIADNHLNLPASGAGDGIEADSATVRGNHVVNGGTGVGIRLLVGGAATNNLVEGGATAYAFASGTRAAPVVVGGGGAAFDPLANVDL